MGYENGGNPIPMCLRPRHKLPFPLTFGIGSDSNPTLVKRPFHQPIPFSTWVLLLRHILYRNFRCINWGAGLLVVMGWGIVANEGSAERRRWNGDSFPSHPLLFSVQSTHLKMNLPLDQTINLRQNTKEEMNMVSEDDSHKAKFSLKFSIDTILRPDFGVRYQNGTEDLASMFLPLSSDSYCITSQLFTDGTHSNELLPPWIFCTRYSDRPSSGSRIRKPKRKELSEEEKRPRTAFTSEQLERLKSQFLCNRYLTEKRRQELAHELGLNESQIKIWFQNKRAKLKKSAQRAHQSAAALQNLIGKEGAYRR